MNYAIELKGLCKSYSGFSLQNVTFSLPEGSIMGFIGENGAGKTTTIKAILGLIRPDAGEIAVLGKDPAADRRRIGEETGAVLDGSFFSEGLRTGEISAVMARLHPRWDRALFESYCRRFSLPGNKAVRQFSKGMKAKLALTAALSHHPRLLILDEATSGLDPVVRSEMLDLFLEFIEDETHSILLSSHITSDLEKIADYITFLHNGRIIFSLSKDEMLTRYGVLKCGKADVVRLDERHIIGRRESRFDCEFLVDNREDPAYRGMLAEPASIDDIMTFFAKGGNAQ